MQRSFAAKALKIGARVWFLLAGLVDLTGIIGTRLNGGFSDVQELMSPFNVVSWLAIVITFLPGIGMEMLAERLSSK